MLMVGTVIKSQGRQPGVHVLWMMKKADDIQLALEDSI
jgi:hypothetical protein